MSSIFFYSTPKVGPLEVCCKISKKMKGDPLKTLKMFRTKVNAEKNKWDPVGFFNIHSVAKHQKKLKKGPFDEKQSHKGEKTERGPFSLAPIIYVAVKKATLLVKFLGPNGPC